MVTLNEHIIHSKYYKGTQLAVIMDLISFDRFLNKGYLNCHFLTRVKYIYTLYIYI